MNLAAYKFSNHAIHRISLRRGLDILEAAGEAEKLIDSSVPITQEEAEAIVPGLLMRSTGKEVYLSVDNGDAVLVVGPDGVVITYIDRLSIPPQRRRGQSPRPWEYQHLEIGAEE